ncbi:hypothetical protein [Candidatus Finniella inopinata]|uniref:Uncharacterized protein n=1 Tax=Candidatus Finniella inopinata TaxID=1696036 RepID=A0A4Q7DG83_9PROT|nr:hypothetical protein [Candidatus Finniella inopinata]RZI45803.1 hypothetical protein EQU50_05040 [Candidatus Finniella inopinata]
MKKTTLKQETLKRRFTDIYDRHSRHELSCEEASDILGISVRTLFKEAPSLCQPPSLLTPQHIFLFIKHGFAEAFTLC